MNETVMLIEDDREMQRLITEYLTRFGYDVKAYADPLRALEELDASPARFAAVVLDLMLPGLDGFDVCKHIKSRYDLPVIISSARGDIGNKIHGYELGADDYLAKPYEPRELILRLEAVLRRYRASKPYRIGALHIDPVRYEVRVDDYDVELTKTEFAMLHYLATHPDRPVSREQLAAVAGLPPDTKARTVDMHISNIRHKIGDDPKTPRFIKSLWGIGYKFVGAHDELAP